jgi:type VI secretion system protein ImpC
MSKRFDFGGVNLWASEERVLARPTSETPFTIAILGDFSGRANRGLSEPQTVGERRPHLVDRDNLDEVLSQLQPELALATESKIPLVFEFSELDDFHPDRLYQNEAFQRLKRLRERLEDPSTFTEVAEQLGILSLLPATTPAKVKDKDKDKDKDTDTDKDKNKDKDQDNVQIPAAPNPVGLASRSLLEESIKQTESRIALEPRPKDGIHEFARQLATKYAVSVPDTRQPEVIAAVDRAIGDLMRAILHHPDFQALEAIWRATFRLVRQIETGPQLKIYVIDISKQELAADLAASEDLADSGTFRLLVDKTVETPGADPFTIVVGAFRLGSVSEDLELLPNLARVADRAGAVFLAEADPRLLGCSSLQESSSPRDWKRPELESLWEQVRSLPEAGSIGLSLPRFLLRLPYGKETARLDSFDFEEFSPVPTHGEYLWGNPAFFVALLLGQSFAEAGWQMRLGSRSQIENLPLHTYRVAGVFEVKPCAEVLLTEEAVDRILDQGLIPLISYKGRDAVRVARFQSIARPHGPLKGRWDG